MHFNTQHDIVANIELGTDAIPFTNTGQWVSPWLLTPTHAAFSAHFVRFETVPPMLPAVTATFRGLFGSGVVGGSPMKMRMVRMHYDAGGTQIIDVVGSPLVQPSSIAIYNGALRFETDFNTWIGPETECYVGFQVFGAGKVYGVRLEMVYDVAAPTTP